MKACTKYAIWDDKTDDLHKVEEQGDMPDWEWERHIEWYTARERYQVFFLN